MAVQVTFRNMPVSDAVEATCWRELSRLEHEFDRIMTCHVTIAESHHDHYPQGHLYDVRVNLSAPDREVVVNRGHADEHKDEDITAAVLEAFQQTRHQLRQCTRSADGEPENRTSNNQR